MYNLVLLCVSSFGLTAILKPVHTGLVNIYCTWIVSWLSKIVFLEVSRFARREIPLLPPDFQRLVRSGSRSLVTRFRSQSSNLTKATKFDTRETKINSISQLCSDWDRHHSSEAAHWTQEWKVLGRCAEFQDQSLSSILLLFVQVKIQVQP